MLQCVSVCPFSLCGLFMHLRACVRACNIMPNMGFGVNASIRSHPSVHLRSCMRVRVCTRAPRARESASVYQCVSQLRAPTPHKSHFKDHPHSAALYVCHYLFPVRLQIDTILRLMAKMTAKASSAPHSSCRSIESNLHLYLITDADAILFTAQLNN